MHHRNLRALQQPHVTGLPAPQTYFLLVSRISVPKILGDHDRVPGAPLGRCSYPIVVELSVTAADDY